MVSLSKVVPEAGRVATRFEILGVFGSGKSTIAGELTGTRGVALRESHEANPFWGKPAELLAAGYLPYDLGFLVDHAFLCACHAASPAASFAISDWSFVSDRVWASMRLGRSFDEYAAVWHEVSSQAGTPAGYIHLEVAPDVIVERIMSRGRAPEAGLYPFIRAAAEALDQAVAHLPRDAVLVLDGTAPVDHSREKFSIWSAGRLDSATGEEGAD